MMNSQLNHPQFFTYCTGSIHILNSENRQSAAFSIIQSFFVTVRHQALISVVFLACVFLFNSGGRRAELNNTMTTIEESINRANGRVSKGTRQQEREKERKTLFGLPAPAVRQLYGEVENKQITEHRRKDSGLVISTCQ